MGKSATNTGAKAPKNIKPPVGDPSDGKPSAPPAPQGDPGDENQQQPQQPPENVEHPPTFPEYVVPMYGVSAVLAKHPSGSGEDVWRVGCSDHEEAIFGGTDFQTVLDYIGGHIRRMLDESCAKEAAEAGETNVE
jgi:hypothetical protein